MHPSPTELANLNSLTSVIGLGIVGFSGHAVFPTIKADMEDKTKYVT